MKELVKIHSNEKNILERKNKKKSNSSRIIKKKKGKRQIKHIKQKKISMDKCVNDAIKEMNLLDQTQKS